MGKLIVTFSGWVECDPAKTTFTQYGNRHNKLPEQITGEEWMELEEDVQGDYVLECLGQAYTNSIDGELQELDIEVEDE